MIKFKQISGFTLIELLVTISIILLLTGAGIAGFINFNDRQQVQTTVKDVQGLMRAAQVKARAGEGANGATLAEGCVAPTKLKGYQVAITADAVVMSRYCVDEIPETPEVSTFERSRVTLNNVTVTKSQSGNNVDIVFLALRGGINMGNNTLITYTIAGDYSDNEYVFEVLNTGEITQGDFE